MAQNVDAMPGRAADPADAAARPPGRRLRPVRWLPLAASLLLGIGFYAVLGRDVHLVLSPLVGQPVPQFSLPPVKGRSLGLSSADLHGDVALVNVFASWCVACREEHPQLMQLRKSGAVPLDGIDYKDQPDDAAKWLDGMGDPYARTGADISGRVAIDWGVYGVPETFVVDPQGRIAYKQIGPVTQEVLDRTILPLVAKLRQERRPDGR